MDFDDQLRRYFGTTDLEVVTPAVDSGGNERTKADFWLTHDKAHHLRSSQRSERGNTVFGESLQR